MVHLSSLSLPLLALLVASLTQGLPNNQVPYKYIINAAPRSFFIGSTPNHLFEVRADTEYKIPDAWASMHLVADYIPATGEPSLTMEDGISPPAGVANGCTAVLNRHEFGPYTQLSVHLESRGAQHPVGGYKWVVYGNRNKAAAGAKFEKLKTATCTTPS
ncbi:MAG: hypothetical protein M1829_005734 [Trizodia sp. TS-e1964]|nr:MAG: hypothetical protein M1829_005734 [Trizodia sp. TS-e1964]